MTTSTAPKAPRASRRLHVVSDAPEAAPVKAPRAPRAPKAPKPAPGFMTDVRSAFQAERRLELGIGFAFAGFVPVAVFMVAHKALPALLSSAAPSWSLVVALVIIILGGLAYSAPTVYTVGLEAFDGKKGKALGFTILIEGVMTLVPIGWLQVTALVLLIAVNAVGTSVGLARGIRKNLES